MQNRTLLDEISALPADVRRHLYAYAMDEKTIGRLNQTSKTFNLFGNDMDMWRMKIRREIPGIYMPQASTTKEYIGLYLLIIGMKELYAFSLEYMINSFFRNDFDDQDNALGNLMRALVDGTWQPRSVKELDELAMSLHADEKTYAIVREAADILPKSLAQLTHDTPASQDLAAIDSAPANQPTNDEETQRIAANIIKVFLSGEHRVQWLYSTVQPQEALADEATFHEITLQFAFGSLLHNAAPFLFARNHFMTLISALELLHSKYSAFLDIEIPTGEGPVRLGEQLFMMSLGAEQLEYDRLIMWLPCTPMPELAAWMIDKNATCVRAGNRDILTSYDDDEDRDHIFFNPLYLTIEAIAKICNRENKPKDAIRDLQKLKTIAINLINHGEVMDKIAVVRGKVHKTPAWLITQTLSTLEHENLSELEQAIRTTLIAIQQHQPVLQLQTENKLKC